MKILHINSYYSGSNLYKNLYDKQKEDGLDIKVYVPIPNNIDATVLTLGEYTTISTNHNKYDRIIFHVKHKKIYKDIVKKYEMSEFSIAHAHSLFSNGYIALRLKKDFNIPYIVAVRNTDVNTFFKYMVHLRKLGVEILAEAQNVIFLSKSYKDLVIEKYVPVNLRKEISDKAQIIPNGIADFWFNNKANSKESPKQNKIRLVYAGAINKNKNLITTIKAIEVLKQKGYDIIFTVVGKIEDKSIHQQIVDLPFVNYITPKPKEELLDIYRVNEIFVMPSKTETFGLVYAEAMSQGLPVIYSKGQGFDEQFEEGVVGYHVDCFDFNEIASKIICVVENYAEMSNACIAKVEKFRWDTISSKYTKLYCNK